MTKRKRSAEDTTPARYGYKRLYIDIMDITWSKGINRRIEPSHVRELQDVFMNGGLERSAPENHMFVLCSVEDVRRALKTRQDDQDYSDEGVREHLLLRLCVDSYWFAMLEAVLDTLNALPLDMTQDVGLGDWDMLAPRRMGGLLRTLDDEAYKRVYTAVSAAPNLSFVDLKRFLRPKRLEIETAVCVLHYVLQRRVLDLAIYNADAFWAQEVQTLTTENVTFVDMADYGARFSHVS
ncbi:hypothetical protein CKAH01_18908 [Colletotrichum kahawae]|uniref:Uncharacterized protein n=1 Tax=Colletotrichum kahawae TaxID=34407 RepID=A0AAE0D2R9_COLKA|nr:hypothetical protein CKAH01_18908 [Colletotrichum kahawae]